MNIPLLNIQQIQYRAAQAHARRAAHLAVASLVLNFAAGWMFASHDNGLGVGLMLGGLGAVLASCYHRAIAKRILGGMYIGGPR